MAEKYDVLAQKSAPLSSALGTDMPVIPTRKDGSPDYMAGYMAYKEPQLKKTESLLKEQGEFEGLQREEEVRQKGVLATGKAANLRKLKSDIEESQTAKDLTTLEDQYMHAAFVPTQATMGEMAALFSLFGVTGMLIGAGGKGNAQAAMSAMSGMMKGYREGNEDLYKREKATFDENLKVMGQRKEVLSKRLEQIAKLATMDKEAADQDLDALLAEQGADFYKKYKDKFGLAKLIELDKEVNKTYDKKYDFVVKEDERVREEARRREEKLADEARRKQDKIEAEARAEAQRVIDDKRRLAEREEFARFAAGLKGGAGGAGSDTASDVKNFLGVNFGSGKQADAKYEQVAAASNTMAEALALSNAVRKNPDVVGRIGQAKGFIDRYVKSLSSDGLETDKTPAATNKAEQDALLFSKRYAAYLIRYEQALAGSAKGFTVSFMNRFNNLMQQNQFNPEGFDGLMKEQIREIHARTAALSTKITPEGMIRLGVAQTRDPDAIEALQRMQGGAAGYVAPGGAGKRGGAPGAVDSIDAERSKAKAAIAAGAPEAAVRERFKSKTGQEL